MSILNAKLVAALEAEHKTAVDEWTIHRVDKPNCEVCALLREAKK